MTSTQKNRAMRMVIYIVGLFLMALGVAFSVQSNLGVSPVNSLPYVISLIAGVPMSTCVIAVFCGCIVLQVLLLRKEFRPIQLTQILFSTVFGYFVDVTRWMVGGTTISSYGVRLILLAVSICLISIGIALYVEVNLVPMPMEGLTLTLANKTGRPFHNMKAMVDCIVVGVGVMLSLIFLGRLAGIREGTVLSALAVGKMVGILKKRIGPAVQKLCGE